MLSKDSDNPAEIFVQKKWQGRELSVPLTKLEGKDHGSAIQGYIQGTYTFFSSKK